MFTILVIIDMSKFYVHTINMSIKYVDHNKYYRHIKKYNQRQSAKSADTLFFLPCVHKYPRGAEGSPCLTKEMSAQWLGLIFFIRVHSHDSRA
jgi:hypothetical protein